MKTKEEIIKEAWGYDFDQSVDEYGWKPIGSIHYDDFNYDEFEYLSKIGFNSECVGTSHFRPISLQGIEDNNGWIKIESKADLPKENYIDVFVYQKDNEEPFILQYANGIFMSESDNYNNITHYQPIEKPKPPIF